MAKFGFFETPGGDTELFCDCPPIRCFCAERAEKATPENPCDHCGAEVESSNEIVTADGCKVHADCLAAHRINWGIV